MNYPDYQSADSSGLMHAASRWLKISAWSGSAVPFFGGAATTTWISYHLPRDLCQATDIVSWTVMALAVVYLAALLWESRCVTRRSPGWPRVVLTLLVLFPLGVSITALLVEGAIVLGALMALGVERSVLLGMLLIFAGIAAYSIGFIIINVKTIKCYRKLRRP